MATVRLTREEAKDPANKLPHVCMKCGASAVVARPTYIRSRTTGGTVEAVDGALPMALQLLGIWAFFRWLRLLGSKKVTLYTPLCQFCDEHVHPEELARLESVEKDSFTISGVCDAFVEELESKREKLRIM